MQDRNGEHYTCYSCGRKHHIAVGCKYEPVEGAGGDRARALRSITTVHQASEFLYEVLEQGIPTTEEPYCMVLAQMKEEHRELCAAADAADFQDS